MREPVNRLTVRQHVRPQVVADGADRRCDECADDGISHRRDRIARMGFIYGLSLDYRR